jgi:energy-coupling factor transporter ATP-binding protein EcfA2
MLDGRSPLIVLSGAVAPTDLAARAARCAFALRELLGGAPTALVTGRAEVADRLPVGELIDRVVQLLPQGHGRGGAVPTRIDDVTAGLLGARFDTSRDEAGYWLRGAREDLDTTPQLLGRPIACVGRDRELALLAAEVRHCIAEPAASAMLVTGPAGMGKSRLRQELVRALHERDEPIEVWVGQADPMSAGSAFSLLASALRRGIGLVDGEPLEARRRKVRARVARHERLEVARVAAFLGEIVGAPFPDEGDAQLQAARRSPMMMRDQLHLAWQDFLQVSITARIEGRPRTKMEGRDASRSTLQRRPTSDPTGGGIVIHLVATWQRSGAAAAGRSSPRARPRPGFSTCFAGAMRPGPSLRAGRPACVGDGGRCSAGVCGPGGRGSRKRRRVDQSYRAAEEVPPTRQKGSSSSSGASRTCRMSDGGAVGASSAA